MNTTMLLIGIGLGFFISSCLTFYVIAWAISGGRKTRKNIEITNEIMLRQQLAIQKATERIATALESK